MAVRRGGPLLVHYIEGTEEWGIAILSGYGADSFAQLVCGCPNRQRFCAAAQRSSAAGAG
jgi:hypothetical protein